MTTKPGETKTEIITGIYRGNLETKGGTAGDLQTH